MQIEFDGKENFLNLNSDKGKAFVPYTLGKWIRIQGTESDIYVDGIKIRLSRRRRKR